MSEENSHGEIAVRDKWDGEDEEDDVADNWDDDDEESDKDKSEAPAQVKPVKTKRKLADIIAEKEKKRAEELERKKREREEAERSVSPSEKLAEKIRIQKIKEDSDLEIATELLGVTSTEDKEECSLDTIDLSDCENVLNFKDAIINKIRSTDRLEKRPFFVTFVEDLMKDLCLNMDTEDVKKLSSSLNTLYNDKVKASKVKTKKKGAAKAKLNAGQGAIADQVTDYGFNEYDDFI